MRVSRVLASMLPVATTAALLVPLAAPARALTNVQPGGIVPIAGNGVGDNGPATGARVNPQSLAYAPDGDLLIAEQYRLRRVDSATGIITTVAGTGVQGYSGDGGQATAATFGNIADVVADANGVLYVADLGNSRVRRIGTDGVVTTLVSDVAVRSLAFSLLGDLYLAQKTSVHRLVSGQLQLVAGGPDATNTSLTWVEHATDAVLTDVIAIAFTQQGGHLLIADRWFNVLRRVTDGLPDGNVMTIAENLSGINDVTVSPSNVAVLGLGPFGIRLLASPHTQVVGALTTLDRGSAPCGADVAAGAGGVVATCEAADGSVRYLPGDGTSSNVAGSARVADGTPAADAFFGDDIRGFSRAADGTLYLAVGTELRSIGTDGLVHTIATDAPISVPRRLAAAPDGTVYVAYGGYVVNVDPADGTVTPVSGGTTAYVDGGSALGTHLSWVESLAVAPDGTLYIGAFSGCMVLRVTTDGLMHTVPSPPCADGTGGDIALDGDDVIQTREYSGAPTRVYRTSGDTVTQIDRGAYQRGVAVLPSGSVETAGSSLLPDGSRITQEYVWQGVEQDHLRLLAEPAGTMLGHDGRTIFRLTPATQVLPPSVTGLQATTGPGSISLSWTPSGSSELQSYAVRILPGTVAPASPVVGDLPATVVLPGQSSVTLTRGHSGEGASFPGLRNEPYTVAIWAQSPGGFAPPATVTVTPPADTTPPGSGSGLSLVLSNGVLSASWTPATDPDLFGPAIARMSTTGMPATYMDGTPPTTSTATTASWNATADGTYNVAVFHVDVYGNVSPPLTATVVIDTTPPATVTGLAVSLVNGRVRATWATPAADAAQVRARALIGASYPSSPEQGGVPVASTATSAEWNIAQYGSTFRIAVFTTDAGGNTGTPALATFVPRWPAALSATVSVGTVPAGTVAYGTKVTIRGTLTKAGTATGFGSQRVELWGRRRAYGAYGYLGALNTDPYGRVAFTHLPAMDFEYQLRHPASAVAAVASPVRTVLVKARVSALVSAATVSRSAIYYVTGEIGPKHVGVYLTLQRFYGGAWHDAGSSKTDGYSRVRFAQRPGVAGTYSYRVVFRGDADHRPSWSGPVTVRVS